MIDKEEKRRFSVFLISEKCFWMPRETFCYVDENIKAFEIEYLHIFLQTPLYFFFKSLRK